MTKTERHWKRANVVYTGGKSYTIGGKKFVQNRSKPVTNKRFADSLRSLKGFGVTDVYDDVEVPEDKPKRGPAPKKKKKVAKKAAKKSLKQKPEKKE